MSKLEKDNRGFWHYTSNSGVVYDIDIPSCEVNIVTDTFQDFWDMFDNSNPSIGLIEWKFIDCVHGEIEREPYEIKDWLDSRIEFYEKHERTIKFCTMDDKFRKVYLGTEDCREWNDGEKISVDEMKKMLRKEQPLSKIQSEVFFQNVWWGNKKDTFREMAKEVADKIYELKYDKEFEWMHIGKLESVEDYISAWENGNWYLYYTMDELIQDEWERGGWESTNKIGDCAQWCYNEIDKTIFRLPCGCVIQYYN